ncbi:hypothetical protein T439DRAFT_352054 [Meredithblackwellia eburnea MCA 4105]
MRGTIRHVILVQSAWLILLSLLSSSPTVLAQQQTTATTSTSPAQVSQTSSRSPQVTSSATHNATATNSTSSLVPTLSVAAPSNSTSIPTSSNSSIQEYHLATKVDAAFGVMGGLLVTSAIPMGLWGSRNRWSVFLPSSPPNQSWRVRVGHAGRSSFFLVGIYAGSLLVGLMIIGFGVVGSVHDPSSTLRGLFLFASLAGGAICGALCVVFWKLASHLAAAFGGFVIGVFVDSVRSSGLISPIGVRYILFIAPAAIGFVLSTFDKLNAFCLLISTSALGAMALVVGVDCFTTAGLKEFFVFNLGLRSLFPKLKGNFPLSLGMQIELGVIAALFVSFAAWQWRGYDVLLRKARELKAADRARTRDEEKEGYKARAAMENDLDDWEDRYGRGAGTGGRSPASQTALLGAGPSTPSLEDPSRPDFLAHHHRRSSSLSTSFLPPMNFLGIGNDVVGSTPSNSNDSSHSHTPLNGNVDWNSYLASRKVLVGSSSAQSPPQVQRRSPAVSSSSMFSPSGLGLLEPILSDDGHGEVSGRSGKLQAARDTDDEDDDRPLALARPNIKFSFPRSRTQSENDILTRPRPVSFASQHNLSTGRLASTSRPRPSSLAFPSTSSPATHSWDRPNKLSDGSRRNTMIDLSEDVARGTHEPPPGRGGKKAVAERIIVGEWSKSKGKETTAGIPRSATQPKVMEVGELEDKHRKRLSMMQAPVLETVKTEAELKTAKAAYEHRIQREGAEMRAKERARDSMLKRESRRGSMASLSILIDKFGPGTNPVSAPSSPLEAPGVGGTFGPNAKLATIGRRQSLGTLLPAPPSASAWDTKLDVARRRPPLTSNQRHESSRLSSISKVANWQDGSVGNPSRPVSVANIPSAPNPPTIPTAPTAKSKLDWLGY